MSEDYIIDTHVFLWAIISPEKISKKVTKILADPKKNILLSIASIWEMQLKETKGLLTLNKPIQSIIETHIDRKLIKSISIIPAHIFNLKKLPTIHSDPFDRLIISQAMYEKFHLISKDKLIKKYPLKVIW